MFTNVKPSGRSIGQLTIRRRMLCSNDIRLFQLLPLGPSENIETRIQGETLVVPVSSGVKYERVSYVWGDGHNKVMITVDGHDTTITKPLELALKRMRLPGEKRTLWIDQLCINQDDDSEKAIQVPLMNQVYTNTTQCLIWLGEIRSDIPLSDALSALELIRFMSENGTDEASSVAVPACLASEKTIIGPAKALKSIALHENEWQRRIRTLQEAVFPSKACVLWGRLTISWDALVRASDPNKYLHHLLGPHFDAMNDLITQVNGLQIAKRYRVEPMDTAFRWGFRKATNPLDKVYGFLGLYPRGTLRRTEVCDYRLPVATLNAIFTADLIEHHKSFHPIAVLTCKHLRDSTPELPSWALDMGHREGTFADVPISMTPVGSSGDNSPWFLMNNYRWYNACGGSEIDWKCFRYEVETNELILTGCFVDEISLTGVALEGDEPGTKHVSDQSVIERIQDWYRRADHFYQNRDLPDHSLGSAVWSESFWRGLVGNLVGDYLQPQRPATESDIALIQQFIYTGQRASIFQEIFAKMSHRKMFVTQGGFLGFGPRHLDVGDQVWILQGGLVPFLLRPYFRDTLSNNRYRLIAPSYVDEIMDGEVAGEDRNYIVTLI